MTEWPRNDTPLKKMHPFNVALHAWKTGRGWRPIPVPNIACSGMPVKASVDEWKALANDDQRLENALSRLHVLFRDADILGSLIDPKSAAELSEPGSPQLSLEDVDWDEVAPLLSAAASAEVRDPAVAVLGANAAGVARAAEMLSRSYILVVTNVPYLVRSKQSDVLQAFAVGSYVAARGDLATMFLRRFQRLVARGGTDATVTPQNWLFLSTYTDFRRQLLAERTWEMVARIGFGATASKSWDTLRTLLIASHARPAQANVIVGFDCVKPYDEGRARELKEGSAVHLDQGRQQSNPDSRITFTTSSKVSAELLSSFAEGLVGMQTSDDPRYRLWFWEVPEWGTTWERLQDVPESNSAWSGCSGIVRWEQGKGSLSKVSVAWKGRKAWNRSGVIVSRSGRKFSASLYGGSKFHQNAAVILAFEEDFTAAILAYCQSESFNADVRRVDRSMKVTNATLVKVPFDIDIWSKVAEARGPLPEPWSDNPTQWLFQGRPEVSTSSLQVAIGRLVGYKWPEQPDADNLEEFADSDGIVCLPSVAGEPPAADRVQQLLAVAFGEAWSPTKAKKLREQEGSKKKNFADWLRDDFFKQHCVLFGYRPFVWHIWDGLKDGFAALVNYHRLDRKTLEKLTYTYLGQDWVERQRAEVRDEVAGAETRLSAALTLQRKLELILEGEAPYDIYVRWKEIHEQPIGWEPDLNDGVRLNIRPFVEAGVLRWPFSIHWRKDRGKNPDGTERFNDVHLTLAEKIEARKRVGRA